MRIICSRCRGEGQIRLVGEKAPLEDRNETHGIYRAHRIAVQAWWRVATRESERGSTQFVSAGAASETLSTDTGSQRTLSATHLWKGLKNLTWKFLS
jgi:hypothetical protein